MSNLHPDRSPLSFAISNLGYALCVCTIIYVFSDWTVDWVNSLRGVKQSPAIPSLIGHVIAAGEAGLPVLVLALLCGLFSRDLDGLTPTLVATHFLGLIDPIAAMVVGIVMVLFQNNSEVD